MIAVWLHLDLLISEKVISFNFSLDMYLRSLKLVKTLIVLLAFLGIDYFFCYMGEISTI